MNYKNKIIDLRDKNLPETPRQHTSELADCEFGNYLCDYS